MDFNKRTASMVTCSPGFVYFVGDNNKQKTLGKIEPTMESKSKDPSSNNLTIPSVPLPQNESRNDKKPFWRRVPPCLAFLPAFTTAMALLLLWSQASALRRQAFDVNLTKDYILVNISMDNVQLVRFIREYYLLQSATNHNVSNVPQTWEEKMITSLTQNKKEGVYLEYLSRIGATSTTAWLDAYLNWRGVMIITDPKSFFEAQRISRNPKTRLLQACLSTDRTTKQITLPQESDVQVTKLAEGPNSLSLSNNLLSRIMSFPLYSVLLAYNTTTLDYLSLDGQDIQDLQVLDTIPWDNVKISIIFIHWNSQHNEIEKKNVIEILSNHSYKYISSPDASKLIFQYNRQLKT